MIKKVKIEQLKPGVFVHDFNCDWAGENVFINMALIKSEKAIEIITSWGIKEVYIDTERGLDVESGTAATEVRQVTNKSLHDLAGDRKGGASPVVPLKEEASIARQIRNEALETVQQTMRQAEEGKHLDVDRTFRLVGKMERSIRRNKDALILLTRIRKKDEYTLVHSISVCSLVLAFCDFCEMSHEMTMKLATGALLHDIGKTMIPDRILNKPGKLGAGEFEVMKRHAEYSAELLGKTTELPPEVHDIALHHHERYDGTGYPHGLTAGEIELGSRMTSICDVYDAITSTRCYRGGIDRVEGLRKLYEWSDHHFDRELSYKFIQSIGVYPVGTCVKLENELAAVVTGSTDNILQPVVRVFYDDKKQTSTEVEELDLSASQIDIVGYDSYQHWSSGKKQIFQEHKNALSPFL